mmetsp:Transcript_24789/g.80056  ORF Transcript_24789/g.80056 Transcript_24789/m.80056 type:complete len:248 (+) Transcript_24789:189-932(+)
MGFSRHHVLPPCNPRAGGGGRARLQLPSGRPAQAGAQVCCLHGDAAVRQGAGVVRGRQGVHSFRVAGHHAARGHRDISDSFRPAPGRADGAVGLSRVLVLRGRAGAPVSRASAGPAAEGSRPRVGRGLLQRPRRRARTDARCARGAPAPVGRTLPGRRLLAGRRDLHAVSGGDGRVRPHGGDAGAAPPERMGWPLSGSAGVAVLPEWRGGAARRKLSDEGGGCQSSGADRCCEASPLESAGRTDACA